MVRVDPLGGLGKLCQPAEGFGGRQTSRNAESAFKGEPVGVRRLDERLELQALLG